MNRAAFLDRDGVINRKAPEGRYVTRWEQMRLLPGVASAIAGLRQAGFRVIVVSNQRCVAKGLVTAAGMDAIHRQMRAELAAAGGAIDAVYYCPHEKLPPCGCRKPAPGMLFAAAREHRIDLAASWMIGDSDVDMSAGRSAGCKTAMLTDKRAAFGADVVAGSLLEAVAKIVDCDASLRSGCEVARKSERRRPMEPRALEAMGKAKHR